MAVRLVAEQAGRIQLSDDVTRVIGAQLAAIAGAPAATSPVGGFTAIRLGRVLR